MNRILFSYESDKFRFAVISTIIAFLLGIIGYKISVAGEHIYFFISAPIATFIPSYLIWNITFQSKKDYKFINVIVIAFILTLVTHYLNFVILGLGRLVCYYLTGNCTDYTGEVESLLGTLTYYSFLRTIISLYYWGPITFGFFILSCLYVLRTAKLIENER